MTTTPHHERSIVGSLVAHYPVIVFLLTAVPLSFAAMSVPLMAQYDVIPGKGLPPKIGLDMEETASLFLVITLFVTVLTITRLIDGPAGVRILFRRMTRWRVPVYWWMVAVLAMPLGTVALAAVFGDHLRAPGGGTLAAEVGALLVGFLLANIWEEASWVGFMQSRLERRHNFFIAAAATAVPFALVHLPLRIINGTATTAGEVLGAFIVLIALCLFIRTLLGAVLRGAANSVLLVAVTHTMFNRSNNVDGLAADIVNGPNRQYAALLTVVVLTVVLLLADRRRLSKAYRHRLDIAETTDGVHDVPSTAPAQQPASRRGTRVIRFQTWRR